MNQKCIVILLSLIIVIFYPSRSLCKRPIKISCIGASITQGVFLSDPQNESYPGQLQKILGKGYRVSNFGASGTTMLAAGDSPYINSTQYKLALASSPDIVFIDLGGNDSKYINRIHLSRFILDCKNLVSSFASLPSHPRIVLFLPVPSFIEDTTHLWDPAITGRIIPLIRQAAFEDNIEVIDMHSLMIDKSSLMPDQIHPNKAGAEIIAKRLGDLINQHFDSTFDISRTFVAREVSSFFGYRSYAFKLNGRECKIVTPKKVAKGRPWIWRARFWGHEPQTDIALLERGFHVAYCDVAELFGNTEAIRLWDGFYFFLTSRGLSEKVALEGMSRGAVYVYNWAAVNPTNVSCIYVDNPVLDLKSWPGSQRAKVGSDAAEWLIFKKDYNLGSDEEAMRFVGSPIDKVREIAKGGYPMLHVCGDADEDVPMEENTIPFEKKVKMLNGNIIVLHKPGFKHHPHSFPNPTPIVAFILHAVRHGIPTESAPYNY